MKAAARNRAEVDALVDKLDGEGNGFITMDDIIAVRRLLGADYARTADMRMQRATCSECSAAHNRDHRRPISLEPILNARTADDIQQTQYQHIPHPLTPERARIARSTRTCSRPSWRTSSRST